MNFGEACQVALSQHDTTEYRGPMLPFTVQNAITSRWILLITNGSRHMTDWLNMTELPGPYSILQIHRCFMILSGRYLLTSMVISGFLLLTEVFRNLMVQAGKLSILLHWV